MIGVLIIGHDAGGKSTIAKFIADQYKYSLITAFANPLKKDLEKLGIPVWKKPYSESVRNLLRQYGETQMTLNGDLFWVERAMSDIEDKDLDHWIFNDYHFDVVICDDCRQHHEYRAWLEKFPVTLTIVLTNNQMTNIDFSYRSVREAQELIDLAVAGNLPNSLVIENTFSADGLSAEIKQAIKEKLNGLPIHSSAEGIY